MGKQFIIRSRKDMPKPINGVIYMNSNTFIISNTTFELKECRLSYSSIERKIKSIFRRK